MAGKDFRLTALLSVRDAMSPAIKAASERWAGFKNVIESTEFNQLRKQLRLVNRSLKNTVDSAVDAATKITAPLAGVVSAMGIGLQQAVTGFASTGDAIDKMATRTGLGVERLQEWTFAARHSGASAEALEGGLKDLSKHIAEIASGKDTTSDAATLFKALGIAVNDAGGKIRPVEAIFEEFSDAIKRNEDPILRNRMAMAALGEGGRALIPLMASGSEGLKEMGKQAHDLGLVMSAEDVAAASKLGDSLDDMRAVIGSVGTSIGAKLAPTVIRMADKFRDLVAANREAFSARTAALASQFAEAFSKIDFQGIANAVLTVADVAMKAFNALGGFNTVLYAMGAIMAGKAVASVVAFGSNVLTLGRTLWSLVTVARTVGIAMSGALGPVGLVLGAIALAAGFVVSNWDAIWPVVKQAASACADAVGAAWDFVTEHLGAVVSAWGTIAKGFFTFDIATMLDGFDQLILTSFNLLPDSWRKACTGWYEAVKKSLADIVNLITDVFASIDFTAWMPKGLKDAWDSFRGKKSESATSEAVPEAVLAPTDLQVPLASAQMSGTMAIRVMAAGGASAQIDGISSDGGLSILGSVGRSDRSMGDY